MVLDRKSINTTLIGIELTLIMHGGMASLGKYDVAELDRYHCSFALYHASCKSYLDVASASENTVKV